MNQRKCLDADDGGIHLANKAAHNTDSYKVNFKNLTFQNVDFKCSNRSFALLIVVLTCAFSLFLYNFTSLPRSEREILKIPRNITELKEVGKLLSRYKNGHYLEIMIMISSLYVIFQSFMIPGSVVFSMLLGYLFPFSQALFIIALCSAIGASCCYKIAGLLGRQSIIRWFPDKVEECRRVTYTYRNTMFICIFMLRLCPFFPNWTVNIISPVVAVPFRPFFWGTFFGVIPLSLVFVKAGTMLLELTDIGVTSLTSVYTLAIFAAISLLPFIFRRRLKQLCDA